MNKILSKILVGTAVMLCASFAQAESYWLDGSGNPVLDSEGACIRAETGSSKNSHPACNVSPDRVVLLPAPDGKVGAVVIRSKQGEQLINTAFGSASVAKDGSMKTGTEDESKVRSRYGTVLQAQPKRHANFVVYFASDSATELASESLQTIDKLKEDLKTRPVPEITVIGYTDRVGSVTFNDKLSMNRAKTVGDILLKSGVSAKAIEVSGRGERNPLIPTEDGLAEPKNRRVEISIR